MSGDRAAVAARLAKSPVSQTINTSFIERDNLTQRQQNRRLTRRTNGFSKDLSWFEKQLVAGVLPSDVASCKLADPRVAP
jgi:IS1 family transposase